MSKRKAERVGALEGQAMALTQAREIVAQAAAPRRPLTRGTLSGLLMDLLIAKLEASMAVTDAARAAMQNPAWLARQNAGDVAALAAYLDQSTFALGDRLAAAPQLVEAALQERQDSDEA
jgi:hypothetical protein